MDFNKYAAEHYADIRATSKIKGPDAIQLASAAAFGTDLFITNDSRLSGLKVDGIQFIVSLDRSPI